MFVWLVYLVASFFFCKGTISELNTNDLLSSKFSHPNIAGFPLIYVCNLLNHCIRSCFLCSDIDASYVRFSAFLVFIFFLCSFSSNWFIIIFTLARWHGSISFVLVCGLKCMHNQQFALVLHLSSSFLE